LGCRPARPCHDNETPRCSDDFDTIYTKAFTFSIKIIAAATRFFTWQQLLPILLILVNNPALMIAKHRILIPNRPKEAGEDEKKLLQAKHRLEEAAARGRVKEHKVRTRRLIQESAILEKAYPPAAEMELKKLENTLYWMFK